MKLSRRLAALLGLTIVTASVTSAAERPLFRPISFQGLALEPAKSFGADFYFDNHDRDPQGIDIFDVGFRLRYQATNHTQIFGSFIADRVVSLPEAPAIPSAPRDLIFVGPIVSIPNAFNGEHPYLDKRGRASFDAFIPGTASLGITKQFGDAADGAVYGFSTAVVVPMAGTLEALRSGGSSGRPDAWLALLMSREALGGRVHARAGFTLTGKGSWPDQSFTVTGNTVQTVVTKTPIGNRLDAAAAWIRPLTETVAVGLEARMTKEFVGAERIDAISPVDVMIGIHKAFGKFTIAASLLDHFRALPSGAARINPLAGAIDLSNATPTDRNAFLIRAGQGGVLGQLRDGAHILLIGSNITGLPAGATRVPATYNIRSEHNLGYVFNLSWRP